MSYKCKNCGRSYEESGLKDLANTFTGKNWISQKGFCSDRCKVQYENNHKKESKISDGNGSISEPIIIEKGPTAEEIIAEAKAEQMEYELSKKKKEDSALKPWMFDSNFSSADSISKISFPDTAEDVEKTILRIVKTAIEKIKATVNSHEMGIGEVQVGTKDFLKPFSEEFEFVDVCIEKAKEGLKKLRRFEGSAINAMIQDCQDDIDELLNKWYPKLVEKREKKKKKNLIVVGVMLVVVIVFFTWASMR